MNIAVVSANGRSGKAFVELALANGHHINAGIRKNNNLSPHPNLNIVECDATNKIQLKKLIVGQDAVASFIGHIRGSGDNDQTIATQNILDILTDLNISRFISLTGTGVRFVGDKITLIDRILNLSIGIIDPARINDGKQHVKIIKDSKLDWTIIRVLKLQNTKPKPFALLENGPAKIIVSRQEVAEAVLQVIEQKSFINKAPIIGKSN